MSKLKDQRPHIIVVEDEAFQRETLIDFLNENHYRASGVDSGAALRKLVERDPPALVLLDLRLPGGEDGFALARFLRERSRKTGIIMLTASGDTIDQVVGLETGADDYVAKPYEPRALLARIKAVLRRAGGAEAATTGERVRMGRCLLDLQARRLVALSGEEIPLRAGEYELLKLFAENPNRPLSRDWLLETTSHREMEAFDRAIDIRILRIRRKIEVDPARPTSIRTVRSAGYMFVPPED
ncbi:response regulator [Reyranella sp.]|uniref:response regulator n=1 Tax=Reyranella sp. TaxID=1929291 RepID=UPI003D0C32BA